MDLLIEEWGHATTYINDPHIPNGCQEAHSISSKRRRAYGILST